MKKLYFLHIPKTAGQTVESVIKKELNKFNIPHYVSTHFPQDSDLTREVYIAGHMGTYPINKFKDLSVACLLRNPIEARVSYFNFIYNRQLFDRKEYMSIPSFFDKMLYYMFEDENYLSHNNYQSRNICNPMDERAFDHKNFFENHHEEMMKEYINGKAFDWFIKDNNTSLKNTISNIDSFDIVDVVENIDKFILNKQKWFNENYDKKIKFKIDKSINISFTKYENIEYDTQSLLSMLSIKQKNKILENNEIDFDAYMYVKGKND